jgi:hypothetical protein
MLLYKAPPPHPTVLTITDEQVLLVFIAPTHHAVQCLQELRVFCVIPLVDIHLGQQVTGAAGAQQLSLKSAERGLGAQVYWVGVEGWQGGWEGQWTPVLPGLWCLPKSSILRDMFAGVMYIRCFRHHHVGMPHH